MKNLNGFVRQRENPKGSMVEGYYIVYESFYYSSEYIKQIDHTLGIVIWDDECDEDKSDPKMIGSTNT